MISRVADHCFWLGRHLERAESMSRLLHVTASLALDAELTQEQCWLPVLIVSGERPRFFETCGPLGASDREVVQRYLTWDEENPTSLVRSVSAARDNARSIRDVVSIEVWEAVNELYLWILGDEARAEYASHRYGFYRHIRQSTQLCLGLSRSTMLHDTPLDFTWLGLALERVGQTSRILDVHHHAFTNLPSRHQVVDTALWISLLRTCSGFEPFMKRHRGRVDSNGVAAFLLLEPSFPRSIAFALDAAYRCLADIRPPGATGLPGGTALARLGALGEWVRETSPDVLAGTLHEILTHVVAETAAVCDGISSELFGMGA